MSKQVNGAGPLGFEDTLWKTADKLRGSMDASEYKQVVLGVVFLKYVDDAFAERRAQLALELKADGIVGNAAGRLRCGERIGRRGHLRRVGVGTPRHQPD